MGTERHDAVIKEYGEVCSNFRMLTEIRFKLLALLPIATAAATAFKGGDNMGGGSFVFPLFGLIATIGLVTYNTRNDQLYDELVGRAASLERELGLADGAFANRPHAWLRFHLFEIEWKVDHRTGVGTIYLASIAAWLFLLLAALPSSLVSASISTVSVSLVAFGLTVIAIWYATIWIKGRKKQIAEEMRSLAAEAIQKALSTDLARAAGNHDLIDLCARLGHETYKTVAGRARFYSTVDPDTASHYLPCVSKEQAACHLVALLTDLSPRWLFDCATNRRGVMSGPSPVLFVRRPGEAGF